LRSLHLDGAKPIDQAVDLLPLAGEAGELVGRAAEYAGIPVQAVNFYQCAVLK
jgi:hypothetical protein